MSVSPWTLASKMRTTVKRESGLADLIASSGMLSGVLGQGG